MRLAYLIIIFEQLDNPNSQMQQINTNIIKFIEASKSFIRKLENGREMSISTFEHLSSSLVGSEKQIQSFQK